MSMYIVNNGEKQKVNISATDVQLLDIDGKFKSKNLEDAMKEVGGGTAENMNKIEKEIGEGDLNTNDKTIKGAINELNQNVSGCLSRKEMIKSPLEIGKWIDFHKQDESTDFDLRLYLNDNSNDLRVILNSEEHTVITTKNLYDGLDSTNIGFALDSKQGKVLYDLLSDLKQKYDSISYAIHDKDLNEIKGMNLECYIYNCSNVPKGLINPYGFLKIRYFDGSGFVPGSQTLQEFISYDNSKVYRRTFNQQKNVWSSWISS